MCNCGCRLVHHFHCWCCPRACKGACCSMSLSCSDYSHIPCLAYPHRYCGNIAPYLPCQAPRYLGVDAPLRWMDSTHHTLGAILPRHEGPCDWCTAIPCLPHLSRHLAPHRCNLRHHFPVALPTQSPGSIRSTLQPRCSPLVQLHHPCCRNSRSSR